MQLVGPDLDVINMHSAYPVSRVGDFVCRFRTDYSLTYEVGFVEDYSLRDEGVYQFFVTEVNHQHFSKDFKVRQNIWRVIEEFFRRNQAVMIYICDTSDGRQAFRGRLFAYWFEHYEHKDRFTFIPEDITVDGIGYFAAIIVRNDHPELTSIKKEFLNFIKELREKWESSEGK